MRTHELITLRRDCAAIVIPDGYQVTLPAGSDVILTQSLGGDYTVMTTQGYLARISGKDADAIGGTAVELLTIAGGGHAWPGGQRMSPLLDAPSQAYDATPAIWRFFAAHPQR